MNPMVTVLMPVYNGEKYLREAIESILNQTFTDFEFLIIDDGSKDGTWDILNNYKDQRMRLVRNNKKLGLSKNGNLGIKIAKGKYIARMDADDISPSKRLEHQIVFMEKNPEIGLCGTWVYTFGNNLSFITKYPLEHNEISMGFLFNCCMTNVMYRNEFLKEYDLQYNISYESMAEDYEFWVRCSDYFKVANIPEVLLHYRIHDKQVSKLYKSKQDGMANTVMRKQVEALIAKPSEEDLALHYLIAWGKPAATHNMLKDIELWLSKLALANNETNRYPEPQFSAFLGSKYFSVCYRSVEIGFDAWRVYHNSPLSYAAQIGWSKKVKFFAKGISRHNLKK